MHVESVGFPSPPLLLWRSSRVWISMRLCKSFFHLWFSLHCSEIPLLVWRCRHTVRTVFDLCACSLVLPRRHLLLSVYALLYCDACHGIPYISACRCGHTLELVRLCCGSLLESGLALFSHSGSWVAGMVSSLSQDVVYFGMLVACRRLLHEGLCGRG